MDRDDGTFSELNAPLEGSEASKGNNYLVLVAIDKYIEDLELPELKNPVKDAERLKDVLLRRYNFQEENSMLKLFKNKEATLQNISTHLRAICEEGDRENDNLLFYFAGHGNENGFYINRADSNEKSLIDYSNLADEITNHKRGAGVLDNYLFRKKFRHVLFIFDCCYAGAFQLGKSGNTRTEDFSRYAVASCAADKQAADEIFGLPGGSPFSLKFAEILEEMGENFTIDDIKKDLRAKVAIITKGLQSVGYESLNFEMNGRGQFLFELKQSVQQKWKTAQIQHSILEHLGFKEQRGNVESTYIPKNNSFNVFSACAETNNTHEILRKVIFRSASQVEDLWAKGAKLPLEKNPEMLDVGDDIWETFYRQMHGAVFFERESISESQKREIVDWLIGRLLEESMAQPKSALLTGDSDNNSGQRIPKTIILQGQMSTIKDKILTWCNEFYQFFMERIQIYPIVLGGKPEDVNKIVFYFQEIKKGETKITPNLFDEKEITKKANIIITSTAKKIGIVEIAKWLKELPEEIVTAEERKLGRKIEVQDFLPANKELTIYEFEHSDFLKRVITYFELSLADSQEIFEELYNQKNESK